MANFPDLLSEVVRQLFYRNKNEENGSMHKSLIIGERNTNLRNMHRSSLQLFEYIVGIFSLAAILFVGCERHVIVPRPLIGEWKTSAPKYADRTIKFDEHIVTYGIGDGETVYYKIEKIVSKQGDGGTVYTFYYKVAKGEEQTLTLTYRPDSGGSFKMKHSDALWEKADSGQPRL